MPLLFTFLTSVSTEDSIEEVNETHPEVLFMIEDTLRQAKDLNFEQPFEKHTELLEEVIKEVKCSSLVLFLTDGETKNFHLVCVQLFGSFLLL